MSKTGTFKAIELLVPQEYSKCETWSVELYKTEDQSKLLSFNYNDLRYEAEKGNYTIKVYPEDFVECPDPKETRKSFEVPYKLNITITKPGSSRFHLELSPGTSKVRQKQNVNFPSDTTENGVAKLDNLTTWAPHDQTGPTRKPKRLVSNKTTNLKQETPTTLPLKSLETGRVPSNITNVLKNDTATKMSWKQQLETNETNKSVVPTTAADLPGLTPAIVASVGFLCFFAILSFAALCRKKWKQDSQTSSSRAVELSNGKKTADLGRAATEHDSNHKKRCILVLNAEDHSHHVKTVDAFVRFLDHHSCCHVLYAPWCLHEYLENKRRWLAQALQRTDFVILVNSELAYHQIKANSNSKGPSWSRTHASLTYDLFALSIAEIAKQSKQLESTHDSTSTFKTFLVNFNYTPKDFHIYEHFTGLDWEIPTLEIPSDVNKLLSKLRKNEDDTKGRRCWDKHDASLLWSSTDGKELIQCINTCEYFEKQHATSSHCEFYKRFDSGFSSSISSDQMDSLAVETDLNTANVVITPRLRHMCQIDIQAHNNLDKAMSRPISIEDNTLVQSEHPSEEHYYVAQQSSRFKNSSVTPDDFEEPSVIADDDVLSQQLRQEIYELNRRMMISQMQTGLMERGFSREDDFVSLGGQSV